MTPLLTFRDKYFVKVKVNIKFTLEEAMKAKKGVKVLLYTYFNLDARWGLIPLLASSPPGKRPDTHPTGVLVGPRAGLD